MFEESCVLPDDGGCTGAARGSRAGLEPAPAAALTIGAQQSPKLPLSDASTSSIPLGHELQHRDGDKEPPYGEGHVSKPQAPGGEVYVFSLLLLLAPSAIQGLVFHRKSMPGARACRPAVVGL